MALAEALALPGRSEAGQWYPPVGVGPAWLLSLLLCITHGTTSLVSGFPYINEAPKRLEGASAIMPCMHKIAWGYKGGCSEPSKAPRDSSRAQGTLAPALRLLEPLRGLREGSYLQSPNVVRRECVLLTLRMTLEMRPRED